MEMLKNLTIKGWNHTVRYIASVCYYLEDTAFFLPLENIMKSD
jgi:hypothetical protein